MATPGENYLRIRQSLAEDVALVVAAKGRSVAEVAQVVEAGATIIGQNYVQEAQALRAELGEGAGRVELHMIGHLQRNKVRRALPLFDVIQSVDSGRLARAVSQRASGVVRAYVEVNVGGEGSKYGVPPDDAEEFVRRMSELGNIRIEGLMTMEPYSEDPEEARPYFRRMKELFERLKGVELPNVRMEVLSMGMTNSYRVAVEEGATMVRIGTAIFGPRPT
ncbi:MAG: YggS family pyridoxal phosphate-dependent enzyme [Candidatus Brocadiae bacterium]|nr:YggS family pyridoxal phosphate-dependent enzyme [Candidatus Brocadiia bacterium]